MGLPDEETGLLRGGRRSRVVTYFSQIMSAIFFALFGFSLAMVFLKHDSTPSSNAIGLPTATSTNSKYDKFQALNFQLYTGGAPAKLNETNATNPECSKLANFGRLDGDMYCYMGHKNQTRDVFDRMAVMTDAVERAYELSEKSSDTLKIFVAPEFFFRGRNGAYIVDSDDPRAFFDDEDGECKSEICEILVGLEKLVAQARFEDWLFLFGTAIVSEALPVEDTWDYLFYNFGILYKGYDPATTNHKGKRFLIPKRYVSNMDFLTPERQLNPTHEILQDTDAQTVLNPHKLKHHNYDRHIWRIYKDEVERLGYTMIEYGWLLMDGITLSIEICLDHDMRTALTAYLVDSVKVEPTLIPSSRNDRIDYVEIPKHQAQISLVSSAGMTVNPASLALADEGSIILQDGMESQDLDMKWGYECFRYDWQFSGGSEVIQRNATMTPTEVVFHYDVHRGAKKHSLYEQDWKHSLRGVFSSAEYEPKIIAFEPAKIARV